MRCALLARIAVAAFRSALDEWLRADPGTPALPDLHRAFDMLHHNLT